MSISPNYKNRSLVIFFLFLIGLGLQAQPFTYWPDYNQTPIGDINQVPWDASDNIVNDWDWSLPDGINPAPTSKLIIGRNISFDDSRIKNFPIVNFPCNPVVTHWIGWNILEPSKDNYNWDGLRHAIDLCSAKGYKSVLRFMTCRVTRSAPSWLAGLGINKITHDNGEVDYDPADPIYHQHYLDLIADFGATGIQNREDVVGLYVGYSSKSWGDEGIGPIKGEDDPFSNDGVQHVIERLDAWAAITDGIRDKVVMGGYSNHGFSLGFGIRRGFVEHYMYHTPDDIIGQKLDANNYMYVDENNPLIANNAYNGEENEEYGENWVEDGRFGNSLAAYPYRYFSSNIRLLQMRCNAVLFSEFALMPEMLAWVGQELGRTRQDAPDIFCFLRETYIRNGVNDNVKNFERWLYQRDTPGYETQAVIPVDKNYDSWMYDASMPYDYIARKGKKIGFAADDVVFPTDVEHNVAIKVSFWDGVAGSLKLVYHNNSGPQEKTISASGTDAIKTATFFIKAKFDATGFNYDFELHSDEEVPVSFVRVIKNEFDTVSVSGVSISPASMTLFVGTSGMLTETVLPSDAFKKKVNWSTSDPNVAIVSSIGLVSAIGVGSATITATTIDGEYTANCAVTVEPGLTRQVSINNWNIEDTTSMYQDTTNSDKWTIKGFYIHENTTDVFQSSESGLDPEAGVGSSQAFKVVIANSIASTSSAVLNTHIIDISEFGDGPYKFSFQAKSLSAPPGSPFWVLVRAYNADSADVSSVSITKIDNGGTINYSGMESGYKEQSVSAVLSGDTAKYLSITIQSAKYNNSYWFDNFTLEYGTSEPIPVTGVSVLPTSLSLNVGSTEVLTKTVAPLEAIDKTVSWSSGNESVATVNANGEVRAVTQGSATITVTTNDGGFEAICEVTVNSIAVTGVSVSPSSLALDVGSAKALNNTVSPSNATDQSVIWSSGNESVATVNASGLVTAVAQGSATIAVTTNDGGFAASCNVTVNPIAVTAVSISPDILTLDVGASWQLTETVAPTDAADKSVTWSTSDESIATVSSSGEVMAVAPGSATITVSTNNGGYKDSCELTVNTPLSVASIQGARVKLYPNPLIEGELSIVSNFNIEGIRVFDLSGTLIQEEQNCFSRSVKMNLDHLKSGMYFIQIETKQFSVFEKVLIQ